LSDTIANTSQAIKKSSSVVTGLNINIGKIFEQVIDGGAALAATQTRQRDINRDIAAQLQSSLESMKSNDVAALVGAFATIQGQLVSGISIYLL